MLGRVDRRIVTSGDATLRLDAKTLALEGRFGVDEGLVDFSRSDAPSLGDDVEVIRRPAGAPLPAATSGPAAAAAPGAPRRRPCRRPSARSTSTCASPWARSCTSAAAASTPACAASCTSPRPAAASTSTARCAPPGAPTGPTGRSSTSTAALLTFVGPIENPRLDIEATRPEPRRAGRRDRSPAPRSTRASACSPSPTMSDMDKLSWLLLGRANDGTGDNDTALLQRAALALLSGEGPGATDRVVESIGLDEISVRQSPRATPARPSSASASSSRRTGTSATSAASTPPPEAGS